MDYPAKVRYDRVKEATNTLGTGTYVLTGATPGFHSFVSLVADGSIFDYGVTEIGGNTWENGIGRYSTATNSITRVKVESSSNDNLVVDWATVNKQIFITVNAASLVAMSDDSVLNSLILG
jgi:hypothetical protein